MEFLNLVNTDQYLRNLLNYGIEGVHWEKVDVQQEELDAAEGKPYIYDCKVKLDPEKSKDYSVPYWVQGGLFQHIMFWKTNRSINGQHSKSLMTRRKKRHPLVLTLICQKSAHRWQDLETYWMNSENLCIQEV